MREEAKIARLKAYAALMEEDFLELLWLVYDECEIQSVPAPFHDWHIPRTPAQEKACDELEFLEKIERDPEQNRYRKRGTWTKEAP